MTTLNPTLDRPAAAQRRPSAGKCAFLIVLCVLMLMTLKLDLRLLDRREWGPDHYGLFKWWLIPHAIAAGLALLLGPLQLSTRLRKRSLSMHRVLGRIYLFGALIGSPLGAWIEWIKYEHGRAPMRTVIWSAGMGALLAGMALVGVIMARGHAIQAHQRWMIRSYAVAMVFLEVRFVEQIPSLQRLMAIPGDFLESHHISDGWMYIVGSLVAAELILWRTKPWVERPRMPIPRN